MPVMHTVTECADITEVNPVECVRIRAAVRGVCVCDSPPILSLSLSRSITHPGVSLVYLADRSWSRVCCVVERVLNAQDPLHL